jgi:hypothetical protein
VALALFGLIHGLLIWAGDILLTYALSGAILLLFRKRQQKTLLWWAGSLIALPIVLSSTFLALYFSRFRRPWMEPKPTDMKKIYGIINIYAHGTVRQIMAQNWVEWKQQLPFELFAIYAAALFLLGMWVWGAGIVQRLDEYRGLLKRVCAWCLPVGLIINIYVAVMKIVIPPDTVSVWGWSAGVLWLPGSHILSAGYVSGLALIFMHEDWRRSVVSPKYFGYCCDGLPADGPKSAWINNAGVAVDSAERLYISDAGNNRVRLVSSSPTQGLTPVAQVKPFTPPGLQFPSTQVGSQSTLSFTVTNKGSDDLVMGTPSIAAPFSFVNQNPCAGNIVPPDTTCTYQVVFAPTQAITYQGRATVTDNSFHSTSQSVGLSGTGTN